MTASKITIPPENSSRTADIPMPRPSAFSENPQPAFVRLRPTGLLQEHLKRDVSPKNGIRSEGTIEKLDLVGRLRSTSVSSNKASEYGKPPEALTNVLSNLRPSSVAASVKNFPDEEKPTEVLQELLVGLRKVRLPDAAASSKSRPLSSKEKVISEASAYKAAINEQRDTACSLVEDNVQISGMNTEGVPLDSSLKAGDAERIVDVPYESKPAQPSPDCTRLDLTTIKKPDGVSASSKPESNPILAAHAQENGKRSPVSVEAKIVKSTTPIQWQNISSETAQSPDAWDDMKKFVHSQVSLKGSTELVRKGQSIVTAKISNPNPAIGELEFLEGDTLLVSETTNRPGWLMARHEATGKTGFIRAEDVREMDSFFADIVALADQELSDIVSPSLKSPVDHKRTDSQSSRSSDYWAAESSDKKMPHLRQLAKNSRFNESVESDISRGDIKRSRAPTLDDSWSLKVGQEVSSIIDKEEKKRQEAIYEYFETEKGFLCDMEMVLENYQKPFRELKVLSEAELSKIFSNLALIIKISSESVEVYTQLQLSMNGIMDRVGDALLRELPKLREYAPFCSNLAGAVGFVAEKKKGSPFFAEKLAELGRHPYFGNMDLSSFLLKPMQRITKIPLLIREILKRTAISHPDYNDLQEAEAISQEILLYINGKCGEVEELRKLEKTQRKLNADLMPELGLDFFDDKKRKIIHGSASIECNDKKISAFLFDDNLVLVISKNVNKSEKYTLYRPLISLWLLEQCSYIDSGKKRMVRGKSAKDPLKTFTIYDPLSDSMYELCTNSPRERDTWATRIDDAQKKLQSRAKFNVEKLKLPSIQATSSKSKKALTSDFKCGVKIGSYMLFGHSEGLSATKDNGIYDFYECPGFNSGISQIYINETVDHLVLADSKKNDIESYPMASIILLLDHMFDESRKGTSPPGMKVTKLTGSKNAIFSVSGIMNDIPYIACASSKYLSLYQYNLSGKFFKKVDDVNIPEGGVLHSISFLKNDLLVGVSNKFYILEVKRRSFVEVADPTLAQLLENSEALASFVCNEKSILLCYNNMGILFDTTTAPYRSERYYIWSTPGVQFALAYPYVVVYGRNFIEVWNLKKGTLRQAVYAPLLRVMDLKRHVFSATDNDSQFLIATLKPAMSLKG